MKSKLPPDVQKGKMVEGRTRGGERMKVRHKRNKIYAKWKRKYQERQNTDGE